MPRSSSSFSFLRVFSAKTVLISPLILSNFPVHPLWFDDPNNICSQSQWLRCLRREPSSQSRMLGSWIRISLKAWMSVCVYSVFVLSCV
jgi:hypothetical protein